MAHARTAPHRLLLAAALVLAGAAAPLHAQGGGAPVAFSGRVTDAETGLPVSRAVVTLWTGRVSAVTDAGGRFRFDGVEQGPHVATVRRLGYVATTRSLDVPPTGAAELPLVADPVLLEGVTVNADRLAARRRTAGTSVSVIEADELLRAPYRTLADLVSARVLDGTRRDEVDEVPRSPIELVPNAMLYPTAARNADYSAPEGPSRDQAYYRGAGRKVDVFVDEVPARGGLRELEAYAPRDVFLVESYGRGKQVRVYTNEYLERLAVSGGAPTPVITW